MNSHEAGEGWLQIGDNVAGLYQPAGEVGAAIGGAEQVPTWLFPLRTNSSNRQPAMLFSPQNLAGMLDPSALYAQAASAAEMLRKGVQP